MTYADQYEKIYLAYINKVPISYISITKDKYYNLQDYIPPEPSIDKLQSSIENVKPILNYWLFTIENYVVEYFKNQNLTNDDIDEINKITLVYVKSKLVKADFEKIISPLNLKSPEVIFIKNMMKNYTKELSKLTVGITYYCKIFEKPSIQDFATSTEMPIVVNKELIESDKETSTGIVKTKEYVISDIKADTEFTDSKFINYFLDKTKQGYNIMILPISDFSIFKKIRCYIKNPLTQKENYKLFINTTPSLWTNTKNILEKNIKLKLSDFQIYSKRYIIKIKGNIEQNLFYHFLMTNKNLFDSIVPIDSIKILKTNIRSYVRFVSRSLTLGSAVIYNENEENIIINYISYIESYRDIFYIQYLISCINVFMKYREGIQSLYDNFLKVSLVSEKGKVSTIKKILTNKSCQKVNAPIILPYNESNLQMTMSNDKSYGFLTKEHLNKAYNTDIQEDYILLKCGIDENGNETNYKYFGIGQNKDQQIYACCYENENSYVKNNAVKYKKDKDIVSLYKGSNRILTGNKNLKGDDIGYLYDPIRSFLKEILEFDESIQDVYRKSFAIKEENNVIELLSIVLNKNYNEMISYIDSKFYKISQSLLSSSNLDLTKIEYLNIIEDYLKLNIYVLSKNGIEVGNYKFYYIKPFINRKCIIIYKNINERDNKIVYSYELVAIGDNKENIKKELTYEFNRKVNYKMYKSLLLSTNTTILKGVINRLNMNNIFYRIADYQLIDDNGKTYGIIISKNNNLFQYKEDKVIFFTVSSNMNIPVYYEKVKNANINNIIKIDEISKIITIITENVNEYNKYLSNMYTSKIELSSKDIDIEENIIGLTYGLYMDKNEDTFDLIVGNKPVEIYFPIYPEKIEDENIINLPISKSIYRIPYAYSLNKDKIFKQEDPMLKNIIISQIYNNFITFIVNLANDQSINLYNFSKYILYENYNLNIETFYENYVNYKKIQKENPNIFYQKDDKVYVKLPDPYYSHVKQFLKNPRSIILNRSFSDISDLLRIIQLSDPTNNDIVNKHTISNNIVDLIEPFYVGFNNKTYLVQKINESSIFRLNSILNAWDKLKINLGYNCNETYDYRYLNEIIENYKLNIAYYDNNKNIIMTRESKKNTFNILFINIQYKSDSTNKEILENMTVYTDIYIMLYIK